MRIVFLTEKSMEYYTMCDVCDVFVVCLGEKVHNSATNRTYGCVAVDEENPCQISLESLTRENMAKNTNVSKIGKT